MDFSNLGIALGAYTDEDARQRELAHKDTAEKRAAEQFDWQRAEYQRKKAEQDAQDAVNSKYAALREKLASGDHSFIPGMMGEYNSQKGAWGDGHTVAMQSSPGGSVMHHVDPKGNVVRSHPMTPANMSKLLNDAHMQELMYTSPHLFQQQYNANREHGIKQSTHDVEREYKGAGGVMDRRYGESNALGYAQLGEHTRHNKATEGIQGAELGLRRDQVSMGKMGSPITMYDNNGNPAYMVPTMAKDGMKMVPITTQEGWSFTPKSSGVKPLRAVDPEVLKAASAELAGMPKFDAKAETAFRTKWGDTATHILGADPMLSAAGGTYGGGSKGGAPALKPTGYEDASANALDLALSSGIPGAKEEQRRRNAAYVQSLRSGKVD